MSTITTTTEQYFSRGVYTGHVVELMQISRPHGGADVYVLFYDNRRFTPSLDAVPVDHWRGKQKGEFTPSNEGVAVVKDTSDNGDWQLWIGTYQAINHAYYTIEGVKWRVMIDTVGWPLIVDKVLE